MRSASICSLIVLMLLLAGCGQPEGPGPEKPEEQELGPPEDVRFDPLALSPDKVVVPQEYPRQVIGEATPPDDSEEPELEPGDTLATEILDIDRQLTGQVYRVQLYSTQLYSDAQNARRVAEEIFDRPVHVDYEVPYFKVRVGTFAERDEAEEYSLRARGAGYEDAWIVIVNLDVNQPDPLYDSIPGDADSVLNEYDPGDDG